MSRRSLYRAIAVAAALAALAPLLVAADRCQSQAGPASGRQGRSLHKSLLAKHQHHV